FVAHLIAAEVRLPMPAIVLVAVAVGAFMSTLVQLLAFQPIMRRAENPHAAEMRILTGGIGAAAIPLAIAQRASLGSPFGYRSSGYQPEVYEVFGARLTTTGLVILVAGLGIGVGASWWIRVSRQGLALRSLGVDPVTASLMGVNR